MSEADDSPDVMLVRPRSMHPGARLVLAIAGGGLYAAALPPLGAWPLAWIALGPLYVACAGAGAGRGAVLGLAFGVAAASLTSPWFPAMIGDYFDQPGARWPLALFGWILCGAIYHAALGGWLAWAHRRGPVSPGLVGAMWWITEWARANAPVANPWALFGYSQIGFLPGAQIAEVVGPHGVGALLAAAGAAVVCTYAEGFAGRPADRRQTRVGALATVVVVVFALGYGFVRLANLDDVGQDDEIRRALLVQGALPRKTRSDPNDPAIGLERYVELTARARRDDVDLVLWPELALDFFPEHDASLRRRLVSALSDLGVDLMTGGYGRDPSGARATNAVFLVTDRGVETRYDKVRLMAFSEANPLPFAVLGDDVMAPGDHAAPLSHRSVAYGIAICSEAMHAPFVGETVRNGAEVLVTPSVDSWFGSPGGKRQQLEAVAMRAIETRRFVLRPTASGITAAIDPRGHILAEAPIDEPAVRAASYAPRRALTPYVRFGDVGVVLAAGLLVVDAIGRRRWTVQAAAAPSRLRSA